MASAAAALSLALILGSAVYAWRQAREAERLRQVAVARQLDAERAAREAERANLRSQEALAEARRQTELAGSRRDGLLRLSNSFAGEIYNDAATLPGATPVRAKLLNQTLEHLETLRNSAPGEAAPLLVAIDALGSLADTYGGANSNLGERGKASSLLERRAALIEELARLQPGNAGTDRLRLNQRVREAALLYSSDRPLFERRILALEPAVERMLAAGPPPQSALRTGVGFFFYRAFAATRPGDKLRYYDRVAALAAEDEERFGGGEFCWRSMALAHQYAAGVLGPTSAEGYQRSLLAAAYDENHLALNPMNAQARMDLSFDRTGIAAYHAGRGEHRHARDIDAGVYRQRASLLEIDPGNQWYRGSLWYPLVYGGMANAELGDWPALADNLQMLDRLARESAPPAYAAAMIHLLRGLSLKSQEPQAACASIRAAGAVFQAAPEPQQLQFAPRSLLDRELARCRPAEENGGSAQ